MKFSTGFIYGSIVFISVALAIVVANQYLAKKALPAA
jgi:hypothetical protein